MNYNINSSGLYDVTSYNFIAYNATISSSLIVNGSSLATETNLNNLSTYTKLNIDDLNTTSTWIVGTVDGYCNVGGVGAGCGSNTVSRA